LLRISRTLPEQGHQPKKAVDMTFSKTALIAALGGSIVLAGCNTNALDPNYQNTRQGATIGAGLGAALGALTGRDGDRAEAAVRGGLLGAAAGGLIGNSLDRQEADLRQSINNGNVQIQNTGDRLIVTLPQDILFATDSFAVRPDLQRDLRAVAGNLQAYPDSVVQIVGHTDSDGDAGYNQGLSERRANAVADVLRNAGVPFNRIQTFGRGEAQPVASNLTPEGKAQNRRVEIVILPTAT
jgi:outer membrane protein OmpA-like peptidoglycan-associated protein